MSSPAKVHSVDALKLLRVALIKYAEEVAGALGIMHQESLKLNQWVSHDQPAHWKKQIQVGFEKVSQARAQLAKAKLKTVGGRKPDCFEEKKALRKAKEFLAHAQKQVEVVRHWAGKIQQESDEYRGRLGRLERMASLEIPRMIALLEKMVIAIEEYIAVQAAVTDDPLGNPNHQQTQSRGNSNQSSLKSAQPVAASTEVAPASEAEAPNAEETKDTTPTEETPS